MPNGNDRQTGNIHGTREAIGEPAPIEALRTVLWTVLWNESRPLFVSWCPLSLKLSTDNQ